MDVLLEKMEHTTRLFDHYAGLLTDKQRSCLELYYLQDLSLSEIAIELGVSRQAVHDILRRTQQILAQYEEKLQLAAKEESLRQELEQIDRQLGQIQPSEGGQFLREARKRLKRLLE